MKKLFALLSALMLTASCTACSSKKTEDNPKVAVICKSTDPYWDAVKKAVEDAESEMDLDVSYTAPEKEDYKKQIELIDKAVSDGAQVIVLAPVVMDEMNEKLSEVIDKGIPVITIDSDVSLEKRAAFIGTQNESAAGIAGRHAQELAEEDSVIAVLTHDSASQTAMQRTNGFINVFNIETDGIQLLEPLNCGGDIAVTEENAIQLIKENPEIDIIYATNQPTTKGACQAVESMLQDGQISEGQVKVIGFDYFDGADAYINNGILDGVIVQHPYNMGYFGVMAASYLLKGEEIPVSMMDTGTALVTKDNLQSEDIQFMIHPTA